MTEDFRRYIADLRLKSFLRLLELVCIVKLPLYHFMTLLVFRKGVFMPAFMDSRIPGIDAKYKVSLIADQSSSPINTAPPRLPSMRIGECEVLASSSKLYNFFRAW
ncbi:MAG TPA: hypothetical protein VLX68_04065 [Chitinivibrionales bacterium]|nr:hypothetical protein [Chitinivibrionales bacterium]